MAASAATSTYDKHKHGQSSQPTKKQGCTSSLSGRSVPNEKEGARSRTSKEFGPTSANRKQPSKSSQAANSGQGKPYQAASSQGKPPHRSSTRAIKSLSPQRRALPAWMQAL